jgi:acyl carrier protein
MVDKSNDTEIYERIRLILKEFIPEGASPGDITPGTRLLEDLNLDSARVVGLVLELEDAFHIRIKDSVIETLETVEDLLALVKEKIA